MLSVNPETFVAIWVQQDKAHTAMRTELNAAHAEFKKHISQTSVQTIGRYVEDAKMAFEEKATEIILKKMSASAVTSTLTSKGESKAKVVHQTLEAQRAERASRTCRYQLQFRRSCAAKTHLEKYYSKYGKSSHAQ